MDVFNLRNTAIRDYGTYVRSFLTIKDESIRRLVQEKLDGGFLWPDGMCPPHLAKQLQKTLAERFHIDAESVRRHRAHSIGVRR